MDEPGSGDLAIFKKTCIHIYVGTVNTYRDSTKYIIIQTLDICRSTSSREISKSPRYFSWHEVGPVHHDTPMPGDRHSTEAIKTNDRAFQPPRHTPMTDCIIQLLMRWEEHQLAIRYHLKMNGTHQLRSTRRKGISQLGSV